MKENDAFEQGALYIKDLKAVFLSAEKSHSKKFSLRKAHAIPLPPIKVNLDRLNKSQLSKYQQEKRLKALPGAGALAGGWLFEYSVLPDLFRTKRVQIFPLKVQIDTSNKLVLYFTET
jgi:hypothetical protein